jgi:prepilin-type N-terminal cleavage/methylation domain-containing protein
MKIMRNDSGFTLAEVMVVIAIIGICSAIAVPNFIGWLPKYRLNSATSDVLGAMQSARLRALKDNASVVILFNPGADSYSVFLDNGAGANSGNGIQDGDEPTVRGGGMPAGVNLFNTTLAGDTLRFDARGFPNGAGGTVKLVNTKNDTTTITVNATGNSRAS